MNISLESSYCFEEYEFKRIPTKYSFQWVVFLKDNKVGTLYIYKDEVHGYVQHPRFNGGDSYYREIREWNRIRRLMNEHVYNLMLNEILLDV